MSQGYFVIGVAIGVHKRPEALHCLVAGDIGGRGMLFSLSLL